MRIDVHQHYLPHAPHYPDEVAQQWLHTDSRVQDYATVAHVVAALDAAQFDIAVFQGEYYLHQHNCVARNTAVIAACAYAPQRLRAFAVVQPRHPQACDEIARCLDAGMLGVGELNPAIQQFSIREPAVQRVLEFCALRGVPILFHVNEPVGRAYAGKSATALVTFYEIAARYPELRMVLAHWGGGLLWYETMPAVQRVLRNVYYDTAASPLLFPDTQKMVQMALLCAPHKVLFGSDFPLRTATSQPAALAPFAQHVAAALPDASIQHAWFGDTAAQLFADVPLPARAQVPTAPWLEVSVHTPLVALVERYPATIPVLATYGIHVDEDTAWWQSLRTIATMHAIPAPRLRALLTALQQCVTA